MEILSKFQYNHIIDKYNIIKSILIENYAILIEYDFNAKSKYTLVKRKIKKTETDQKIQSLSCKIVMKV